MANQRLLSPTAVTVAATATQVIGASKHPTRSVLIQSIAANTETVHIGASNVTTSTGIELLVGKSISVDVTCPIFAIRGANEQALRVLADQTD